MKEEEEEVSEFVSATEQLIFFQGLSAIFVFLAYLLSFNVGEFVLAGCLIAVSLLIFGGVWLCKSFLDDVNRKLEVEDLTKYTNNYLIAFFSIGICTIVLRIGVYFAVSSFWFLFFITLVYITTTSSIYYFFVYPTFGIKCEWIQIDEETSENFTLTTVLSHIALLIVSCVLADEAKMGTIMLYQYGCSLASAITFYELARVWWVGVQLIDVDGEKNEGIEESEKTAEDIHKGSLESEPELTNDANISVTTTSICKICSILYAEHGKGPVETLSKNLPEQTESVQKIPMMVVKPNLFLS